MNSFTADFVLTNYENINEEYDYLEPSTDSRVTTNHAAQVPFSFTIKGPPTLRKADAAAGSGQEAYVVSNGGNLTNLVNRHT